MMASSNVMNFKIYGKSSVIAHMENSTHRGPLSQQKNSSHIVNQLEAKW